MNLYFDTEFTGLVPGTTLISLGIVSETGDKFYAEFTDYDESLCDDWIKENVIKNLLFSRHSNTGYVEESENYKEHRVSGSTDFIRKCLLEFMNNVRNGKRVQFVSDVCHYDFYLLQNQVFGGAFKMPDYINPVCYDICQDINEWSCMGVGNNFNVTRNMRNAFDISREKLAECALLELPKGTKHNALYDAEVIKLLYEYYYKKKFGRRKIETMKQFRDRRECCRDFYDSWFEDSSYLKVVQETTDELYKKAVDAMKNYSKSEMYYNVSTFYVDPISKKE